MLPRIGRRPAGLLALTAAGVITAAAPAAAGTTTGLTTGTTTGTAPRWSPDLTAIGGDDVNVRHDGRALRLGSLRTGPAALHDAQATGQLLLAPKDLPEPADRVQARVNGGGSVAVDVRAWRGGSWTEWHPAGSALPSASTRIQVRIVLAQKAGAPAPAVSGVELTAGRVRAPRASAAAAAAYRVFATREGLVGGTTANGHVITERDHFVALPSRRGLSPRLQGDRRLFRYSVHACTESGNRCEYAPL
ncbi:hypothetical protein [Actinomadura sp. 7K507]|uniref:hypothetical protein n=1 Tax=Actinomadura sp. 7K507 TaxID=2530365 RepID=UPI001051F6CF|nr:hypothetical protein [Actinomadura sp. 7K507]TDC87785.1 hypothetical protein E1285_19690 [Actinomadura sp. 7K507]